MKIGLFHAVGVSLLLSLTTANIGSAETAAMPVVTGKVADLIAIKTKAAAIEGMSLRLGQLRSMLQNNDGPAADEQNKQIFLGNLAGIRETSMLPVNIAAVAQIPLAEFRAQVVGSILRADLDGDWTVSRNELLQVLNAGEGSGGYTSEAFFTADMDANNVLSQEEIKAYAAKRAEAGSGGSRADRRLLPAFDFDDDGMFTVEEFKRSMAALKD